MRDIKSSGLWKKGCFIYAEEFCLKGRVVDARRSLIEPRDRFADQLSHRSTAKNRKIAKLSPKGCCADNG